MGAHTPRFVVTSEQVSQLDDGEVQVQLNAEQAYHITKVLRRNVGDAVEALCAQSSTLYCGSLESVSTRGCSFRVNTSNKAIAPNPEVHVLVAQTKAKALDQLVQQACETGVSSIQIYPAQYSPQSKQPNLKRLEKISRHAAEQACLGHVPQLRSLDSLPERLPSSAVKLLLLGPNELKSTENQASDIITVLCEALKISPHSQTSLMKLEQSVEIYIAVGPEGGFSASEIELLIALGFRAASLGPYVARVETAVSLASGIARLVNLGAFERS